MTHDEVAEWDAAYVLGSLSPADRARFEEHLEGCAACRASVAEIAPLPGLLSRVPRARAEALGEDPDPHGADRAADVDDSRRTASDASPDRPDGRWTVGDAGRSGETADLSAAGRSGDRPDAPVADLARARRRRRIVWAVSSAAAVVVLAAVVAIPLLTPEDPPGETVALEAVVDVPVSASVELVDVPWGTRIDMTCRYDQVDYAPADGWGYALVVVADDGTESELSTWRAHAGSTAELSAGTELAPDEIAAIEVRSIENGAVLLQGDPADPGTR